MKKLLLSLSILFFGLTSFSQDTTQNDTLYYKSGAAKCVNILEYDDKFLTYHYTNKKGNKSKDHTIKVSNLKYYVVYNSENKLEYSSLAGGTLKKTGKLD